jgi:hypothetical protein
VKYAPSTVAHWETASRWGFTRIISRPGLLYQRRFLKVTSNGERSDDISMDRPFAGRIRYMGISENWGRALARYAENDSAFETFVKLLDDPNMAVIEVSVASLTIVFGRRGFREVLKRLASLKITPVITFEASCRTVVQWHSNNRSSSRNSVERIGREPVRESAAELIQELTRN